MVSRPGAFGMVRDSGAWGIVSRPDWGGTTKSGLAGAGTSPADRIIGVRGGTKPGDLYHLGAGGPMKFGSGAGNAGSWSLIL